MTVEEQYRRNRLLSVTTERAGPDDDPKLLAAEPHDTQSFHVASSDVLEVLDGLEDWTTRGDVVEMLADNLGLPTDEADGLCDELVDTGMLRSQSSTAGEIDELIDDWERNGWRDAIEYHRYIRDYPHASGEVVEESEFDNAVEMDHKTMQRYAEEEPFPPVYKTYEDAPLVDLPPVEDLPDVDFTDVLEADPGSPEEPLDRSTLSSILFFALGETGKRTFPAQGTFVLKPVPSEGARHPTEGYVLVFDVEDVPSGVYHYSVKEHGLERLDDLGGISPSSLVEDFDPSAVVVYASRVKRDMWRYREPMIYRIVLHDLGHIFEAMRLGAEGRGRPTRAKIDFDDERLERAIGVDPVREPLFGLTAIQ